jgi:hypothetical protein
VERGVRDEERKTISKQFGHVNKDSLHPGQVFIPTHPISRIAGIVMQEEKEAPLKGVPEFLPPVTHKFLDPARLAKGIQTRLCHKDAEEGGFHDIEGLLRAVSTDEQLGRKVRKGNREAERKAISKQFGNVNNVLPGQVFQSKQELHKASMHLATGGGVWSEVGVGAYSI